MKVTFHKGVLRNKGPKPSETSWAETPYGIMVCSGADEVGITLLKHAQVVRSELITTVSLPGIDRESLEVLVANILCRGYLDKHGVSNRDDAVLFILLNEELHRMDWIRKKYFGD